MDTTAILLALIFYTILTTVTQLVLLRNNCFLGVLLLLVLFLSEIHLFESEDRTAKVGLTFILKLRLQKEYYDEVIT